MYRRSRRGEPSGRPAFFDYKHEFIAHKKYRTWKLDSARRRTWRGAGKECGGCAVDVLFGAASRPISASPPAAETANRSILHGSHQAANRAKTAICKLGSGSAAGARVRAIQASSLPGVSHWVSQVSYQPRKSFLLGQARSRTWSNGLGAWWVWSGRRGSVIWRRYAAYRLGAWCMVVGKRYRPQGRPPPARDWLSYVPAGVSRIGPFLQTLGPPNKVFILAKQVLSGCYLPSEEENASISHWPHAESRRPQFSPPRYARSRYKLGIPLQSPVMLPL